MKRDQRRYQTRHHAQWGRADFCSTINIETICFLWKVILIESPPVLARRIAVLLHIAGPSHRSALIQVEQLQTQ